MVFRSYSEHTKVEKGLEKKNTSTERLPDDKLDGNNEQINPPKPTNNAEDPYAAFPDNTNPKTGEIGGPRGPEPTRYGDWSYKGRAIDF